MQSYRPNKLFFIVPQSGKPDVCNVYVLVKTSYLWGAEVRFAHCSFEDIVNVCVLVQAATVWLQKQDRNMDDIYLGEFYDTIYISLCMVVLQDN